VTADPFNVRSRVHEYGGGAYAVRDGVVVFSDFTDNRLYRVRDGRTTPLTPVSDHRYADLRLHPDRDLVLAVREDHSGDGEPVTTIVGLELAGEGLGTVLCSGADFYSDPELSDAGVLAWTEWNHPAMPWDATVIRRGRLVGGAVVDVVDVAGGPSESAVHPRWAPGGELIFVSDRTDWWNLYADRDGVTTPLWPEASEFATPQWVFGEQPYVVLDSSRLLVSRISEGVTSVSLLDRSSQTLRPVLASGLYGPLTAAAGRAAALIEDPDRPARLALVDLTTEAWTDVRHAGEQTLSPDWVSVPRAVSWPSTLDDVPGEVHGWYYRPTNPGHSAPEGELPPLITVSHGGPTSFSDTGFAVSLQYWTSRGFAVLDVNYRGSTGYGRPYRDALRGTWGIVDVADCAGGAAALADQGLADPRRLIVRGGSAGGYTTLQALTTTDTFTAGISFYGVADLESLARDTHKFEARYLDGLIGPYPEARRPTVRPSAAPAGIRRRRGPPEPGRDDGRRGPRQGPAGRHDDLRRRGTRLPPGRLDQGGAGGPALLPRSRLRLHPGRLAPTDRDRQPLGVGPAHRQPAGGQCLHQIRGSLDAALGRQLDPDRRGPLGVAGISHNGPNGVGHRGTRCAPTTQVDAGPGARDQAGDLRLVHSRPGRDDHWDPRRQRREHAAPAAVGHEHRGLGEHRPEVDDVDDASVRGYG